MNQEPCQKLKNLVEMAIELPVFDSDVFLTDQDEVPFPPGSGTIFLVLYCQRNHRFRMGD